MWTSKAYNLVCIYAGVAGQVVLLRVDLPDPVPLPCLSPEAPVPTVNAETSHLVTVGPEVVHLNKQKTSRFIIAGP